MAIMFHGSTLYAVYGRNVGTFGGRAKMPSLKIYDTRDCGTPRKEMPCIPNNEMVASLRRLKADGRDAVQRELERILSY